RSRSRHSAEYRDFSVANLTRSPAERGDVNPPESPAPAVPEPVQPRPAPPARAPIPPPPAPPGPPAQAARHRSPEDADAHLPDPEPQSDGLSVADLMARLQGQSREGGRRRRRDG
ncbi:MAG: hypothetical protein ACK5M9_07510, partial [Mycobacterium sp.]